LSLEELLHTLKKNEHKQIDDIWQQARAEADSIRTHVTEAIARITQEHKDKLAAACQKSVNTILAESDKKSREKKLLIYRDLNETLYQTAVKLLPELRLANYDNIFTELVNELPDMKWEKIIVNPSDTTLATRFFNENVVFSDNGVSGGLIAISAQGKIVVNNTFEKRLERKWAYLLPELIHDFKKRYDQFGPADKA